MLISSPVTAAPTFTTKPQDQKVGLNGLASFECVATGNPPPSVFWTKEGSQVLMFPGNAYGHLHVTPEGTLKIQGVQREDAGFLVCSALSVAGSTTVRAFLQVCHIFWALFFMLTISLISAGMHCYMPSLFVSLLISTLAVFCDFLFHFYFYIINVLYVNSVMLVAHSVVHCA